MSLLVFSTALRRILAPALFYPIKPAHFTPSIDKAFSTLKLGTLGCEPIMSDSESSQGFVLDDSESDAFVVPNRGTKAKKAGPTKKTASSGKAAKVCLIDIWLTLSRLQLKKPL